MSKKRPVRRARRARPRVKRIPTPQHGGLLNISLILVLLHHITNCPVCLEIILQHVGPGGLGVDPYCPGGKGC